MLWSSVATAARLSCHSDRSRELPYPAIPGPRISRPRWDMTKKQGGCFPWLAEEFLRPFEETSMQRSVFFSAEIREFLKLLSLIRIQTRGHLDDQPREQI